MSEHLCTLSTGDKVYFTIKASLSIFRSAQNLKHLAL